MRIRSSLLACAFTALAGLVLAPAGPLAQTTGFAPYFAALEWRSIGPLRGGRSIAAAGSVKRPLEYYFGATGGGLWKTTDGGVTWRPVSDAFFKTSSVGAVAVSESNPDIVYAGMGETELRGNIIQGDGVYKSADAGRTWSPIGLAATQAIARVRVHPSNPDIVFVAAFGNPYGPNADRGVFRSTDGGRSWQKVLYRNDKTGASDLVFDPKNPGVVYAALWEAYRTPYSLSDGGPGSGLFKSADGGTTWTELTKNPGLPGNNVLGKITIATSGGGSNRVYAMVEAEDGGLFRSDDAGATWTVVNRERRLWQRAFYFINKDVFYAGSFGGYLTRLDRSTGQTRFVNVWPEYPVGQAPRDLKERFQWTFPIVFSPVDPKTLYVSSQHLFRSASEGQAWEQISPDLTRHDPSTMGPSGGPIALDQTGVETYPTLFTVAPSRREAATIWVGSDDGLAHVTRDGGKTWQNVTPKELPEFSRISLMEASPHKAGTAYLAANRYQLSDRAPYVFRTDDFGRTWTKIVGGVPPDDFPRAIREDSVRPGLLYLGTEHGIYVSFNDGASWEPFRLNLPVTSVHGIVVAGDDLVIGTHGRGFYVLDNIGILRQLTPAMMTDAVHLFEPAAVTRTVSRGVAIDYYLKSAADRVTLEFLDAGGRVIRTVTEPPPQDTEPMPEGVTESSRAPVPRVPAKAGVNRFMWDLRSAPLRDFPGLIMYQTDTRGPVVPPGRYQARLSAGGQTVTQPVVVRKDARLTKVSDADLEEQFHFATEIGEAFSQTSDMVVRIRRLKAAIASRLDGVRDQAIRAAGDKLTADLTASEGELYQYRNRATKDPLNFPPKLNNKIAVLLSVVDSGDGKPTEQAYSVYRGLSVKLAAEQARLQALVTKDLAAFNAQLATIRKSPVS